MGKYLIPAFPSHKGKDAALKYALSMIDEDIERRRVRDLTGNEIQPVCSGQLKLATVLEFFRYWFSDSFGGN
ncbi:hypothetical protein AB7X21_21925, partial [Providencia rettgeri]